MSTQPIPFLTPGEYLNLEREAPFRSEYVDGEMVAMSGGTTNHARLIRNALRRLDEQLEGRPCEAFAGDHRLYSAAHQLFTYPDVLVACRPFQYLDERRDTILDARVVIEVLSPLTKNYDRGEKFRFYRSLPSLTEYVVLAQDSVRAEHHALQPDASWNFREFVSPADMLELKSVGCRLLLAQLYAQVEFDGQA